MRKNIIVYAVVVLFILPVNYFSLNAQNGPFGAPPELLTSDLTPANTYQSGQHGVFSVPALLQPDCNFRPHASGTVLHNQDIGIQYTNVFDWMAGKITGLTVSGGYYNYRIRVRGSFHPPLIVIDGMSFHNRDDADVNSLLLSIPVEDIQCIEVLKSAAEAGIYGGQAGNGVIRIKTK